MPTIVPPIKCQGIKTKLVPFISENLNWDGEGVWYEPFLGSGVVLFNIAPQRAVVNDRNEHIIRLYQQIQSGEVNAENVRKYLEKESPKLEAGGVDYYYEVRNRFNAEHSTFDLLFLNRSCFNGLMRFNKSGGFNVPFCQKPERFSKAYITKISNQVQRVSDVMKGKDWVFQSGDWFTVMEGHTPKDCVYLDPPYIGRDTNYVGEWSEADAERLAKAAHESLAKVLLSMWKENKYRENEHIAKCWSDFDMCTFEHFYHVGSKESLRNAMTEALLIKEPSA